MPAFPRVSAFLAVALIFLLGVAPLPALSPTAHPPGAIAAAADWVAQRCVGPGGAILVHPGGAFVSGYFGNITASGLVAARLHPEVVRNWMNWYISHARGSRSGLDGVPDDVTIRRNGTLASRALPDSTDAYGATFLILARAAYDSGDAGLRSLVKAHENDLHRIASSVIATQQPDGLTWARPRHHIKYAIDNEQVYRGLRDGAALAREAFGERGYADALDRAARRVAAGLATKMWDPRTQTYRPLIGTKAASKYPRADMTIAYPDALAQMMAVVYGAVSPNSLEASSLVHRASAALLRPAANSDSTEFRFVTVEAQRIIGDVFDAEAPLLNPALCVDAGWYLQAEVHRSKAIGAGPSR
jgi:hypothetical protein